MKTDVEYFEFMWPMKHFLITSGDIKTKSNIIAVSFCMPVSKEPPLIACAIGRKTYSCELIKSTKEFIVNVPTAELKQKVYYCGYHSGRILIPIIGECIAHMECKIENIFNTGDKNLFIGKVIEAYADEEFVKGKKKVDYSSGDFPRKIYGTRYSNKFTR